MRIRMMTTLATVAGASLLLTGCDLFSSGEGGDPSPTPDAVDAPAGGDTATPAPAPEDVTQDQPSDADVSDEGAGTPPEGLDPNADYNYPDRPLGGSYIRIGNDVYTTNDWAEATCTVRDGGISFEAGLVGPEHDTRSLFGQVGMHSEPDLVGTFHIELDGGFLAWAIQGEDITGHTVGTFHSLVADPDAGVILGHGEFSAAVEHLMPATDPPTFADGEFHIVCGEVTGS